MTQASEATGFAGLHKQQYMNLFTYKKSGEAIKTPVWFALKNGKVYVMTTASAGKAKRIRNNPRVLIGPSDGRGTPLGPTVEAQARVLPTDEEIFARAALDEKYGLMKAFFDFFITLRGTERAWIEITPA